MACYYQPFCAGGFCCFVEVGTICLLTKVAIKPALSNLAVTCSATLNHSFLDAAPFLLRTLEPNTQMRSEWLYLTEVDEVRILAGVRIKGIFFKEGQSTHSSVKWRFGVGVEIDSFFYVRT